MYDSPFPPEELDARIAAVRSRLAAGDPDGIVISVPENIYYLTGLDHWGFFACHLLVVPRDGELVLTCRAMEGITVGNQVGNAAFLGHSDSEDIADYAVRAMARAGLRGGRIGMEMHRVIAPPASALNPRIFPSPLPRPHRLPPCIGRTIATDIHPIYAHACPTVERSRRNPGPDRCYTATSTTMPATSLLRSTTSSPAACGRTGWSCVRPPSTIHPCST